MNNVLLHEDEMDPNTEECFNANIHMLNNDQRIIFENIQQRIDRNEGDLIFIDAPGGTGKTFLLNILLSYVHKNNQLATTASSGIAATLLKPGCTAHSRFKQPIPVNCYSACKISPLNVTGRLLHDARLIVWDEALVCHRYLFEALKRTLKDVMNNDLIFGGKLIILGGDFRQILLVVRRAQKSSLIGACLKKNP
ncbi:ATP-dependent DNA helicase PIF2-like [Octopus sinensis]|uniref:ATP-dependent DNA helicase n=1 Tax=Octopus sinensis TaxID=2607531 RepID=A0A6P7UAG9_9MOLL|nr:ATP-dependent DNA helicase PIF2-like [Octopus sinensis]